MFNHLKHNVYWEGMHQDVVTHVSTYKTFQQTKYLPSTPCGLLQPISPATANWKNIAMDFIVGLPAYQENTAIMVIIGCFSKAAHFGSLPTNFSACKVAELFTNTICKSQLPKEHYFEPRPHFFK